jgi:hypothetical protein
MPSTAIPAPPEPLKRAGLSAELAQRDNALNHTPAPEHRSTNVSRLEGSGRQLGQNSNGSIEHNIHRNFIPYDVLVKRQDPSLDYANLEVRYLIAD